MTYECETVVRDGQIAVHPDLDGQRVRVIVIPIAPATGTDALADLFADAIPGIAFAPLTRDQAHER